MRALDALNADLDGGLIEASAGTGKTYTITTLFLRLLLTRGLTVGEILVVTFTTAATAELRERIRRRLREALAACDGAGGDAVLAALVASAGDPVVARSRLQAALRDFDEAAIFTIHGLCKRVLTHHAFESGVSFDAELVHNQDQLLAEVVSDYWAESLYQASPSWVRHVVAAGLTPASLTALAKLAVAEPDMPVLPEPASAASLEAADARFESARQAAAALWRTERGAVLAILATLSGTKYRATSVPGWAKQMDAVLSAAPRGGAELFDKFGSFTTAGVSAGLTKKTPVMPRHPFFAACDELAAASVDAGRIVDDRLISFRRELIAFARREVPRRQEAARTQGFDDLLHSLDQALQGPGGPALARAVRESYRVALIDEFQDTDPVQYRIFRAIYAGAASNRMFLIGDPKQAIYSFRGADVFAYLRAARDAAGRSYTLDTNYRADPGLLGALNALFARARAPFLLGDIAFVEAKAAVGAADRLREGSRPAAPLRFLFARREPGVTKPLAKGWADRVIPDAIAADIARLLRGGATIEGRAVSAGDVAVLVRKNRQAAAVQEALRALRVPSVLQGDASVFDAPEAREIQLLMAATAEPAHGGALRLSLSTSLFGLDAGAIHALEGDDEGWDGWADRFRAWGQRWEAHGFIAMLRELLDEQEAAPRLLRLVDGERRLTNVLHLAELLHVVASREHLGPAGLLRWLTRMRRDHGARDRFGADAAQVRLESDDLAVKLVTVHKSKGLQYPIVYCPYLWDGKLLGRDALDALRFHDPEHDHRHTLDLGSPEMADHQRLAEREAAAENLRLLYVALTRAQHQVAVVWGSFKDAATSPLAYLLHQPREGAGDLFAATTARLDTLDDEAMLAELGELAAAAPGAVRVEDLSLARSEPVTPPAVDADPLECREITRTLDRLWRTVSFSALVSTRGESPGEVEGHDRDAREAEAAASPLPDRPASTGERVPLDAFPRGARPGEMIHKVFELIDFTATDADLAACVARQLERFRFPVAEWQDVLAGAVRDVLATPLRAPGAPEAAAFTLAEVPRSKRLSELEFIFPVEAHPARGHEARRLFTRGALADAFAAHARAPVPADYAETLRRLPFGPAEGFLRGFIDLVFEHEGRFYVVDYKSNHLGSSAADYAERTLGAVMAHEHYTLQYHLYVLALHRYLTRRLPGYDYDDHVGGALYLFVRGMAPERGASTGVFADRPPRALIEALSSVFAGTAGAS